MRSLTKLPVSQYRKPLPPRYEAHIRDKNGGILPDPEDLGAFEIVSPETGEPIRIFASTTGAWDHVSASCQHRCPTWGELNYVYRLFFDDGEVAMQLHVPADRHINIHSFTLHLWRSHDQAIPTPPKEFV